MAVKNTVDLLNEQLGKKGTVEVFTTVAQTSKDFYAVHFVNDSVITNCTITGATNDSNLDGKTIPAGTVIFAPFTAINLTSGLAIGYNN
jgi:hypothetical protein|tara:strand:+ start:387 stop:653 length:267 start_codon:yes stop_codon:yes gene_type:complete